MKIQFLGATDGEVTGSRNLLTFPSGLKILVDIGLMQGSEGKFEEVLKRNGREFEFDVTSIDYVVITHGHVDHNALLPLLIKRGFKGKVIATAPTGGFAAISLPDSAKIMASDILRANKVRPVNKLEALYSEDDAVNAVSQIQCYSYNTEIVLDDETTLELKCAGHMLGAAMPLFTYKEGNKVRRFLCTGDTSAKTEMHPFLKVADDIGDVDYILCESTYGDRVHVKVDPLEVLERSVRETCLENGKTLVIPVFAMQRSSEILWLLREIYMTDREFHRIPIFLDSPMAIKAQSVIDDNRDYWGEDWIERDNGLGNIFDFEVIQYIDNYKDSLALANGHPKIILSSSGMCNAGRILNHLESFLPSKGCKILFTGYQAEGTLGRRIVDQNQKSISVNRRQVTIRAEIEQMSFSSHADKNQLVEFIKTSQKGKLKKVFLNHGSLEACNSLQDELQGHLKNVEIITPQCGEEFNLK